MKKNVFFLFVLLLLTSCNEEELLLSEKESPLITKSDYKGLSGIPEFEGVDFSKRGHKKLENGIILEIVDGYHIIDGDIALKNEDVKLLEEIKPISTKAGIIKFGLSGRYIDKWDDGIIPYVIEPGHAAQSNILTAMQEWSNKTSITFIPHSSSNPYAYLFFKKNATDNLSFVGRRELSGPQNIWIKNNASAGVAMHEIGHAIGLIHEHQRSDATNDIIVNESNIKPDWVQWFQPYSTPHYCLNRFNFNSIMSYDSYDCRKLGVTGYSMVKKETGDPWRKNRDYVTTLDIVAVEYFYGNITPVHRYYGYINTQTNDHYYGLEAPQGSNRIIKNINYNYEHIEFYMPANITGTTPLKRYYNATTKNHSFYPYSGYTQDAQIGYVFTSKQHGTVELREYKKVTKNSYHYVTSLDEEAYMSSYPGQYQFIRRIGWVYPGRGDGRE